MLVVAGLLVASLGSIHLAGANNLQQQINELSEANNEKKTFKQQLEIEAADLNDKISKLQDQISTLEAQIRANQERSAELEQQIKLAEEELERQRKLLGENIKQMYIEGEMSTLEMLASSRDLSEFVDKQQYRNSVKNKIKLTLDKITELKLQLKGQKEEVERLIKEQEANQYQLSAQRQEQSRLLALNASERANLDQEIKDNAKRIEELKRQQAIENARLFGGGAGVLGGGGYPWGHAVCIHTGAVDGPCWNYDWSVGGSIWNWSTGGYGYRNCTDWVSFRVRSTGRYVPSGLGNAKTWDDRAPAYGYAVGSTPKAGAAAVSNSGFYGHVMYVEAVNSDGSIVVSDYNRSGTGKYLVTTLSAATASNLSYVYF